MPKKVTIRIGPKDAERDDKRDVTVDPTYAHVKKAADAVVQWVVEPPDAQVTIRFVSGGISPPEVVTAAGFGEGRAVGLGVHHSLLTITMADGEQVLVDNNCPSIIIN